MIVISSAEIVFGIVYFEEMIIIIILLKQIYYHSRGSTPGSADNVICVGSIGSKVDEYKYPLVTGESESIFGHWF